MIRVWYSNQLEKLAERLADNLGTADSASGGSLFSMPPIVVPNRNIETYLRYEIARTTGIAAALNFQVQEAFLSELLSSRTSEKPAPRLLHGAALRAFFLELLSDEASAAASRPLPEPVQAYLGASGDDPATLDLHRFQLAVRLARLVHRYNDSRPDMLAAWTNHSSSFAGTPLAATEDWQRDLWDRLAGMRDHVRGTGGDRWIFAVELPDVVREWAGEPFGAIHIFGFSYLTHGLRRIIDDLGKRHRIDIYTFTPVDWRMEDSPQRSSAQQLRRRSSAGRVRAEADGLDDESIAIRWGQPGRESFAELGRLADDTAAPGFVTDNASSTLGRLQGEILAGTRQTDEAFARDGSVVVLACPGIRREAEIIANEIWRLVRDDDALRGSSPGRLRFPDIAVLVADSANLAAYQAHFRAVFEELHDIPFNMVDLPLFGESRLLEAVLLLLELPLGEFTRPELLQILTHPAVYGRFADADPDRWRSWCLELGVVRGADRADHDGTYIDREVFHWDQGLRRLALGAFMTGPRAGDDRAFRLRGADYSPLDQPADALADVARLLLLVRSLAADVRYARSARLTLTQWSNFFAGMIGAYVSPSVDSERRALTICLGQIRCLRKLDVSGGKVGYRIAWASLREALAGQTAARGYYLADGVVVSPLKEMRALPFRVIFVCGLGEGRFPARAEVDPLDLSAATRRTGDVTPRDRDQYLFLETLACARERIYLSYVARDAQTGLDLSPSALLDDLLRYLEPRGEQTPASVWVHKHPLRRFDKSYFQEADSESSQREPPPLMPRIVSVNFSLAARREWQARLLRSSLTTQNRVLPEISRGSIRRLDSQLVDWLRLCPLETETSRTEPNRKLAVSLSNVRQFLECPLQGWARFALRLREDEEDDENLREDEPFVMGRLRETILLRQVFLAAIQQGVRSEGPAALEPIYDPLIESQVRNGLAPVGFFGAVERRRHLEYLGRWLESAQQAGLLESGPFEVCRFGRAAESDRADRVENAIALDVPLPHQAGFTRVELFGRTEIVAPKLPGSLTAILREKAGEKDFLRGFLDAVVLSLLPGGRNPALHHAHVVTAKKGGRSDQSVRTFRDIDQARAREFLTNIVADLIGGSHAYLLPFEAVLQFWEKGTSIEDSVAEFKESEQARCSSEHGPVRDFRRYDPPEEAEARAMIERRFGLFRESGGMAQ
jgi:exodeoxyribonuclease V gamma subunit